MTTTSTYFTGAGDNTTWGDGNKLLFKLTNADVSKTVDITFNDAVFIKDGYIISRGAPFGAYVDIDVIHPTAGQIGSYGKKIPILGDGWFPLDSGDSASIPAGIILRITVYNSDDSDGIQDPAANFVIAGRIEIFRTA